jgi:hypothetical protein
LADAALCPASAGNELQRAGTQIPFVRDTPPLPNRAWIACVTSERGVDVGFRETDGRLRIGRLTSDRRCDDDLLQDEQVVWYRLSPGTHALCATEVVNRRANLPYRSEGYWVLRGQPAALSLRVLPLDASGVVQP